MKVVILVMSSPKPSAAGLYPPDSINLDFGAFATSSPDTICFNMNLMFLL